MKRTVVLLCLLPLGACQASSQPVRLTAPSPTALVAPSPTPDPIPSFSTPEAAMRFLAKAWNDRDVVSLKRVTNPVAREALEFMRHEAVNLQLDHCTYNGGRKDYDCTFTHDFPSDYKGHDHRATYKQAAKAGTATFVVGPARRSGWYMTVLEDCG